MLSKLEYVSAKEKTLDYFEKANISITDEEKERIEVADFGLGDLDTIGLEILTYVNTDRCCAKELVLFPWQTCPEHRHPDVHGEKGKEETFRCRWGEVYLYVEGEATKDIKANLHPDSEKSFTVMNEIILYPGEQYTLSPNIKHWFQAGPKGAVVSEFSTKSRDEADIFTDENIQRMTKIEGEQ